MTATPRTAAGRRMAIFLLAALDSHREADILAIEAEAREQAEAAPSEGLLHTWAGHIDCDPSSCTVAHLARAEAAALDVEQLARAIYAADLVEPVKFTFATVDTEAKRIAAAYNGSDGGQPRSDALREALERLVEWWSAPAAKFADIDEIVQQARAALRESEEGQRG